MSIFDFLKFSSSTISDETSTERLIKLLQHKDMDVRRQAAEKLCKRNGSNVVDSLLSALQKNKTINAFILNGSTITTYLQEFLDNINTDT